MTEYVHFIFVGLFVPAVVQFVLDHFLDASLMLATTGCLHVLWVSFLGPVVARETVEAYVVARVRRLAFLNGMVCDCQEKLYAARDAYDRAAAAYRYQTSTVDGWMLDNAYWTPKAMRLGEISEDASEEVERLEKMIVHYHQRLCSTYTEQTNK